MLSHYDNVIGWMSALSVRVPRDHGYVSLNVIYQTQPCAGLHLQLQALGARTVELRVGQLQRAEYGSPPWPTTTMLPATWVDGPTIRPEAPIATAPAAANGFNATSHFRTRPQHPAPSLGARKRAR